MPATRLSRPLELAVCSFIVFMFLAPGAMRGVGDSGSGSPRPNASTFTLALNVTNTLNVSRPDEVLQLNLTLPDSVINDSLNFTVRRQADGSEVLSGPLNSTVENYPSGFIHRMRIAFQDSFNASERKGYIVRAGERTALAGDMSATIAWPNILITDGNATDMRNYRIFADNSYDYYTTGIRVYYNHTTWPYQAQSGILVRVAGDTLQIDQPSIQVGWGAPDSVVVDVNSVMVSVHLVYLSPYAIHWGYGMLQSLMRDTDMIWAVITVNVYNNRSVIDTFAGKKINEKFYNHNGFVMETAMLISGDAKYEYIWGTPQHVRQWVKTPALNWTWDQTRMVGLDVGNRSAPAAADLDSDGDLDLIVGALAGTLTGYRNTGSETNPVYSVDQSLAPPGGPWDHYTIPEFGDINGDGLLDLVVGTENGTVIAFRNTGTPSAPSWTRDDSLVAGINGPAAVPNAAPELADLDADGDLDLMIGQAPGGFRYYRNDGTPASPIWVKDDLTFAYLNQGDTRMPGTFSTPEIGDIERDGPVDFVSGTNFTTFGGIVYFENSGTNASPRFTRLKPAVVGYVAGGYWWNRDYSVPEYDDFTGDGFGDFLVGANDGTLQLFVNDKYGWWERHVNEVYPLENGTYRFFYENGGNDGQFCITNYSSEFYGWYVVSNPAANAAIFRYVPDFDRYAYKDRYSGDMYPWSGGNTSYYPFIAGEDGRLTRGLAIGRASWNPTVHGYAYGATYLSQTGEGGGYVMVPMTAMNYTSHESLVMELPYDSTAALYDTIASLLKTPLKIDADADLTLKTLDITTDPTDPAEGMMVNLTAKVWNVGFNDSTNVVVEFHDGSVGGPQIGTTQTIPIIKAGSVGAASVTWNTAGIVGKKTMFVAVDRGGAISELDKENNVANRSFVITRETRTWSQELMISQSKYQDLDPTITTDALGRVWFAWHTFTTKENYDVSAVEYDGDSWGKLETVAENYKHTGSPALAASPTGDVYLIFSSNKVEYDKYLASRSAIWYWAAKYDLWAVKHTDGGWQSPVRFSPAVETNNSDGAPDAAFTPDGKLWTAYRRTYYALYFRPGLQISNTPFADENITARSFDGTSWTSEQIVDNRPGNQGWWGGAKLVVSPSGKLWAFYESEVSGTQFEIYYSTNSGTGWTAPTRLTNNPAQDVRPVPVFDSVGRLWVAWESDRNGNKDIFVKMFDGTTWTPDTQLTTDPSEDMKPSITANPNGYVFVAWESDRTGNKDIFLKVFNTTGWSPDIQVTTDTHSDEQVKIASGAGGIWFAWETDRNGFGNKDIYVKALNIQIPRRGPSDLTAELIGMSYENVLFTWNLSADDWYLHAVTDYIIRCGDTYDPTGGSYADMINVPAGSDFGWVYNRGHLNPRNLFCQVVAETPFGRSAPSNQAGAYKVQLTGHNLISFPLLLGDAGYGHLIAETTIMPSNFTYMRYYDASDPLKPWKEYSAAGPRDLDHLDNSMGVWAGSSGFAQLTVAGVVPLQYRIRLKAGWNLVGYPSMTPNSVSDALAGLPVRRVEGYDPICPPYNLRVMKGTDRMLPGQGYWILLSSDATWYVRG